MTNLENTFAAIRAIPFTQIAKYYGIQEHSNHMCSCPFHKDQHPSMKLYEDHGYCFSCGSYIDNLGLVERLYGLNAKEAAHKIAQDFCLVSNSAVTQQQRQKYHRLQQTQSDRDLVYCNLIKFYRMLQDWKQQYSPKHMNGVITKKFTYAVNNEAYVSFVLTTLFQTTDEITEQELINKIIASQWFKNIKKINNLF